jgi:hypothetical protein
MCVYVYIYMQINVCVMYPNIHRFLPAFLTVMYGCILLRGIELFDTDTKIHYYEYENSYSNSIKIFAFIHP